MLINKGLTYTTGCSHFLFIPVIYEKVRLSEALEHRAAEEEPLILHAWSPTAVFVLMMA